MSGLSIEEQVSEIISQVQGCYSSNYVYGSFINDPPQLGKELITLGGENLGEITSLRYEDQTRRGFIITATNVIDTTVVRIKEEKS